MKQIYSNYTAEDQKVWNILFERQVANLQDKSCSEYLESLERIKDSLNATAIPDFDSLSATLMETTGFQLEVVPGLIPVEDFFYLLAERKFCSSTWVRKMSQLDYLEEPDMFHDIFGHTPLLSHERFANFMQQYGELGVQFIDDEEIVLKLQRLYWFTIEFGLINSGGKRKVYGAGICSSFGETNYCLGPDIDVRPFDLEQVMNTEFRNDQIQTLYYELESFDQLFDAFEAYGNELKATSLQQS